MKKKIKLRVILFLSAMWLSAFEEGRCTIELCRWCDLEPGRSMVTDRSSMSHSLSDLPYVTGAIIFFSF
jgi:hypothetical protein